MELAGQVLRRFPLVARPRPVAKALNIRVDDLHAVADRAEREDDLGAASAVYNQAALIASDCGQPELARQWCHQHADAYLCALPLHAQAARHALEPFVNLARLHIRDGNGDCALRLLTDLFHAVSSRTDTLIDGHPLPASKLTRADVDHREVRQWLWSVLLADGARALTGAGRWKEAYDHLDRHNGIGQRMLDGRQVEVIALATASDIARALAVVSETACEEPWEEAVKACLAYLCAKVAGEPSSDYLGSMLDRYRRLTPTQSLAVFHTRLGLSVVDAAGGVHHPDVGEVVSDLINQTIAFGDAYAARDVMQHEGFVAALDSQQTADLTEILHVGGLGRGSIPITAFERLSGFLAVSEALIRRATPGRAGVMPVR